MFQKHLQSQKRQKITESQKISEKALKAVINDSISFYKSFFVFVENLYKKFPGENLGCPRTNV